MSMLTRFPLAATAGIQYVGGRSQNVTASVTAESFINLTGLTGGLASSPSPGDVVVVYFGVSSATTRTLTISTPGYQKIASLSASDTYDANLLVAFKVMKYPVDTGFAASPTGATTDTGGVIVQVWRNVDQNVVIDVASTIATGTNSVLCNPPSITPVTYGSVIIAGGCGAHARGLATYSSSDLKPFITFNGGIDLTNDVTLGVGARVWTGGAFDPAEFTFSSTDSIQYSWAAATLALRPANTTTGPILISQASTQNTSAGTSLVINKPTGTRENDIMVAITAIDVNASWTGDTGWTESAVDPGIAPSLRLAYKVAGASEGASYTFTSSASGTGSGTIVTYRNGAWDTTGGTASGANPLLLGTINVGANYSNILAIAARAAASITITKQFFVQTIVADADATSPSTIITQYNTLSLSGVNSSQPSFGVGSTTSVYGFQASVKPAASYTKAVDYIANQTGTTTAGSTVVVNTPTCIPGNILLMVATGNAAGAGVLLTVTTPTGWQLLSSATNNTTPYEPCVYVFARVVDGSEAASYTITYSSTGRLTAAITTIAGANPYTLPIVGATSLANSTSNATATSIYATSTGMLIYVGTQGNNNQGVVTFTPPSGMTEIVDFGADGTLSDNSLVIAYQTDVAAGDTGDKTATASSSAGTNYIRALLVHFPAM